MSLPSFNSPLKTVTQVALAGVMAFGLTAAVNTLASSGKTQLKVITHLDTPKPGKLNQRLPNVQYQPSCTVDKRPLAMTAVDRRTDGKGEAYLDLKEQVKRGQKVTCTVRVPKSFQRNGKTYTLTKGERDSKSTLFKTDITSAVRFSYQES